MQQTGQFKLNTGKFEKYWYRQADRQLQYTATEVSRGINMS